MSLCEYPLPTRRIVLDLRCQTRQQNKSKHFYMASCMLLEKHDANSGSKPLQISGGGGWWSIYCGSRSTRWWN